MATGNAPRGFPRILQWLLAGLMLIIGLAVGILGAKLALVGGTLYFALMGVVMVIAAVLIFRNRRGGILLYAVALRKRDERLPLCRGAGGELWLDVQIRTAGQRD